MVVVQSAYKLRATLFSFLLSFAFIAFSQPECDKEIFGKVLDADSGEPLPYATIRIENEANGAITDTDGEFYINNICKEEVDLIVSFIGYKSAFHHHDFHHGDPTIYMARNETVLESVVIEDKKNAHEVKSMSIASIDISKADQIGGNISQLFTRATGVNTLQTGQNIVKPIIHGLHSNRVLVINNGVRHATQAWGKEHGLEIDANQVSSIRLIKGASTVRYGAEALGGVIQVDAPQPKYHQDLNGEVGAGFETNGRAYTGNLSIGEGYERLAWNASVTGTRQGDLHAPDYQLTNTGRRELGFALGTQVHFPTVDLDLYASHFQQELGILRGSVNGNLNDLSQAINAEEPALTEAFSYDINNPRQETEHDLLRVNAAVFIDDQQFDLQYAYQRNQRREFDVRRGTNNDRPAINLNLQMHSFEIDWDHPSKGRWAGTYGAQLFTENNDNIPGTNTIPFVPNYNTYHAGLFGIEAYQVNKTTLELGARLDWMRMNARGRDSRNDIYRNTLDYTNATFTFGFVHQINQQWKIRSNIGSAWRAPNISELYSYGKHQSIVEFGLWRYQYFQEKDSISTQGVLTESEKAVPTERGWKWITTINYNSNNLKLEVIPYANLISNYFFIRPFGLTSTVRGTFPYFIHDQTDALYTGVDASAKWFWDDQVQAVWKSSFVYARDINNHQYFIGIPPFKTSLRLTRQFGNFTGEVEGIYTAAQSFAPKVLDPELFIAEDKPEIDRSETFDFLEAPDDFFLLNASLNYSVNRLNVNLQVSNLLNTRYRQYTDNIRYFADDLGRNFSISASYQF